jgi:hypothetical protein
MAMVMRITNNDTLMIYSVPNILMYEKYSERNIPNVAMMRG